MRAEDFIAPNGRLWSDIRKKKPKKDSLKAKAWSRIQRKKSGDVRVGKTGTVRLKGKALEELRRACFWRDGWKCMACGIPITWDGTWRIGTPERTYEAVTGPRGEMAHIKSRGAGGSDTLDNVRTLCPKCHGDEHNAGGKPCPKRERPA